MGERIILHSRIPKGWTPRTPAALRHAEHPGTAILWDDAYYEVVEATPLETGGVRYVLLPWRDDHTIRTFEAYDAESEKLRAKDYELVMRQQRASFASRFSGIALGHLPAAVQNDLQNRLGVNPAQMTMLSCIPAVALLGLSLFIMSGALVARRPSPVPIPLVIVFALLTFESSIRFVVAMSQSRGMGSFLGTLIYSAWWLVSPNRARLVSPFGSRGEKVRFTPPTEEIATADALEVAAPFLTLLPASDQRRLAEKFGFDYQRYAVGVASVVLILACAGAYTSYRSLGVGGGISLRISFVVALLLAFEQLVRLAILSKRPMGSVLGFVIRPFVARFWRSS